jgi:hypothetical protein
MRRESLSGGLDSTYSLSAAIRRTISSIWSQTRLNCSRLRAARLKTAAPVIAALSVAADLVALRDGTLIRDRDLQNL